MGKFQYDYNRSYEQEISILQPVRLPIIRTSHRTKPNMYEKLLPQDNWHCYSFTKSKPLHEISPFQVRHTTKLIRTSVLSRCPKVSEILQWSNGLLGRALAPSIVATRADSGVGARNKDGLVDAVVDLLSIRSIRKKKGRTANR